jgi:hypothetical protein
MVIQSARDGARLAARGPVLFDNVEVFNMVNQNMASLNGSKSLVITRVKTAVGGAVTSCVQQAQGSSQQSCGAGVDPTGCTQYPSSGAVATKYQNILTSNPNPSPGWSTILGIDDFVIVEICYQHPMLLKGPFLPVSDPLPMYTETIMKIVGP